MTEEELKNLRVGDKVYYTGPDQCVPRDPVEVVEKDAEGGVVLCRSGKHVVWSGNRTDFHLCETGEPDRDADDIEREYAAKQEALRIERRDQAEARFHATMDGIRDTLRARREMHERLFEAIKSEIQQARSEETVDSLIIVARKFFGEG